MNQSSVSDFIDVIEESDYIDVVRRVFNEPNELNVRISNYVGDMEQLKRHINILASNWADYTDIFYVQVEKLEGGYEHRDEYTEILRTHWGKSTFKNFTVYDIAKLEEGKNKKVKKKSKTEKW